MAEITPVAPVVPAAPATPVAPAAPPAPAAGSASAQDFMDQLTAALKTLKGLAGVVAGAPVPTPLVADATTDPSLPPDEAAPKGNSPASPPDDVLELLATLGMAPVQPPQVLQPPTTGTAAAADVAPPAQPILAAAQAGATAPNTLATGSAAHEKVAHETAPTTSLTAEIPQAPVPTPSQPPVADAPSVQPQAQPQVQPQPSGLQPASIHLSMIHTALPGGASDGATQQGGADQDSGSSRDHVSKAIGSTDDAPTVDHSVPMPMPTATSAVPVQQGVQNAHPTEVVNQIAQQVDLYRLPGSRGVRIQLHPEDLGGVQVTLRYAAGGSLELHINVEHAATGALVQAGLGQLRDALATQGFQPDRLVMSVSAPSASGQLDFSSNGNGGSYRSDPGLTAFMQGGQSGQQRDSGDDAPRRVGRTSASNGVPNTEAAATTSDATTSRIDYRV